MTRPPPWLDPRAAYVHVPFCGHHCGYCDFAVAAGRDHLIELYLDALAVELATLGRPRRVETVFIGGGTPTYLSPDQLGRLLGAVGQWVPLAPEGELVPSPPPLWGRSPRNEVTRRVGGESRGAPPTRRVAPQLGDLPHQGGGEDGRSTLDYAPRPSPLAAEFSIESTPESLTDEKAAVLAACGVTRVSIGVQSFRPDTLAALDRRHTADQIPRAVEAVRRHGLELSFDLIFGAPGSTLDGWAADLDAALGYEPDHISTYGLTYEKGTPLWKDRRAGRVRPVGEDAELAMYEHAIDRLTAAGFEHYEVSNFARPGRRCRHNERYWANEAYYGFGVGAARYVGGRRELNTRDTQLYIRKALAGESATFQSECLGPRDRAFETIGTQLRRTHGIGRGRFREQTGFELDDLVGDRVWHLAAAGLLADDGASVRLTHRGKCVADGIIEELMKGNAEPDEGGARG